MTKKRRKQNIYIGTLLDNDNSYIELLARSLAQANTVMELKHPGNIRYVYKAGVHTANNLNKIVTINCTEYLSNSLSSVIGDQNKN